MAILTAEQVKNRASISIGDTVIVSERQGFKLIDTIITVNLDDTSNVTLVLEWTLNDQNGVDKIDSNKLNDWLVSI